MNNLLFLLSCLTKLYFYTPFMVEGDSMLPTIVNQQLFVVDKLTYRKEFPRRGDIIVFNLNNDDGYFYVKRIIGLPGDTVKINQNGVFIKKSLANIREEIAANLFTDVNVATGSFLKLNEWYLKGENPHYGYERIFKVPPGEYFVLGDNRDHSKDSRFFKDPYIAKKQILGKYSFTLPLELGMGL